jgi:hypothetical protein
VDGNWIEQARRTALAPQLKLLTGVCRQDAGSSEILPGLELEGWERRAVEQGLDGDGANGKWEALLVEGVALQSKYLSELDRVRREEPVDPEQWETVLSQLTTTASIGLALMVELRRVIDAKILGGDMAWAKKLSSFRNKLGKIVAQIKARIGPEKYQEAELLSTELITPIEPVETADTAGTMQPNEAAGAAEQMEKARRILEAEGDDTAPQPIKLDHSSKVRLGRIVSAEPKANRVLPLTLFFVVALAAWGLLVAPRYWKPTVPVLTQQELVYSPAIRQVIARPPSLYVVVNVSEWNQLPPERREELVREIGATAEAAGYTGAQFRTEKGASVASWSPARGVSLIRDARFKS